MTYTLDDLRGEDARVDLTYTYHLGKYSCIYAFYFIHIWLNRAIYYGGMLCFMSRAVPCLKFMHAFLGRMYIACMVLTTAVAMVIHNTGLALGVLVCLFWVLSGMISGWFIIKLHQSQMDNKAIDLVDKWIKADTLGGRSLSSALGEAKDQISKAKTWTQRFISYKAAHGILMTLSWFNIAGRFWASEVDEEFTCFTYPVYKAVKSPIYRNAGVDFANMSWEERFLPLENESRVGLGRQFPGKEWGWMAVLGTTPVVLSILIGIAFSTWAAKRERDMLVKDDINVELISGVPTVAG